MMQHRGLHLVESTFCTDVELVLAMLGGDRHAWRAFQDRYDRLVVSCVAKVTRRFSGIVGQDDVHEIVSTFYVSLLANDMRKLRSFDATRGTQLSTWIGLLATRAAYDHLRSVRREPGKEHLDDALDIAAECPDPFEQASTHERARVAAKMLEDLSDKDRAFVVLHFGEGLEPEAVAAELNISVKTVYSKKHKIQARLASAARATGLAA